MEYDPDEQLSRNILMGQRLLNHTSHYHRICPELSVMTYWQGTGERKEIAETGINYVPIFEEFASLNVDGKVISQRLYQIKNCSNEDSDKLQLLKQEMRLAQARNLLQEILESFYEWENQYSFASARKAKQLAKIIKDLYEHILPAVKCESLNGDDTTFLEDQEQLDQARSRFESALIELGFSGTPSPKRSLLQRILKRFQS